MATLEPLLDPIHSAKSAGLRYVTDGRPGIQRRRRGRGFVYVDPQGKAVRDADVLRRIQGLAIPPAWESVWICPLADGHLQATGRDAKGRKQYRYHPRWREIRDESKYEKMIAFGKALPKIRAAVDRDLSRPGLPREKVIAAVVRLLAITHIRVGNEEYAKKNRSYGLTTMRDRHVDVDGATLYFHFRGKSGKEHRLDVHAPRVARIVARCSELPGHELFQFVDESGEPRGIGSQDVNDYLRAAAGDDFTAKDFRTWSGTILTARALCECLERGRGSTARPVAKHVVEAVKHVAQRLGNTPAVCRRSYVHPAIIDAYLDGELDLTKKKHAKRAPYGLEHEETCVLSLLEQAAREKGTGERLRRQLAKAARAVRAKAA